MLTRRRSTIAAALCAAALAAAGGCGTAHVTATPPPTGVAATSSPISTPSRQGPVVTVPGLTTAVTTSTAAKTTTAKTTTTKAAATSPPPAITSRPPDPATTTARTTRTAPKTPVVNPPAPGTVTSAAPTTSSSAAAPPPAAPPPAVSVPAGSLAGTVVVIDPGHNGANAEHPEIINKQVPAGFGQYKNCNTTGTQTNAGYPEYRFTWNVALRLKPLLQAKGIKVVMTRNSDDGVGPCVNERAAIGNDAHADLVLSIHGDGGSASARGFYVMTAARAPAGSAMAALSASLGRDVRSGLVQGGLSPSNVIGSDGLWQRSDLAGLNLSLRPTVMVECGNMRNSADAALMSSSAGQQEIAQGFADGIFAYLKSH